MELDLLAAQIERDAGPLRPLRELAAARPCRILLPETEDPRIVSAAAVLQATGLARPLLLGRRTLHGAGAAACRHLGSECWLTAGESDHRQEAAELIWRRRRHRGMTQGQAFVLAAQPLFQACALLSLGVADAVVAGASFATADVARAALWTVGTAADERTVSGAFLMLPARSDQKPLLMADCAVVPVPSPEQLVDIGRTAVISFRRLFGRWPAVAFLSFSTRRSAHHAAAAKVAQAAANLSALLPDCKIEGEVQVDAALDPEVARAKGIDWGQAQAADVLVFPDLSSGNIGSKLVERLGGWRSIGPFLQGLRRPVCDLSRGCTALDVVDAAVMATALSRAE